MTLNRLKNSITEARLSRNNSHCLSGLTQFDYLECGREVKFAF